MNLLSISAKNIQSKPSSSLLSVLLFGFGIAIIASILLVSSYLKSEITKNAKGVDLVVGAKGSPLQIILANIFHIDFPTGNIALKDAHQLTKNRLIESAIPISLGDSYNGYRIVGTTPAYAALYNGLLSEGAWFEKDMTATIGAAIANELKLQIGDKLQSSHGLSAGGAGHEEHPFEVVGVMKPTGTVLDQLILVSTKSVWTVHGHEDEHHHEDAEAAHKPVELKRLGLEVTAEQLEEEEITSLLIKYRSPMAAVQLPRIVNNTSNLQAASPPFETARLFSIIGVGIDVVNALGLVIILLSAASVFLALLNSLKERQYELAVMRSMGASQAKIFSMIILEGLLLTLIGIAFGFALAHIGFMLFSLSVPQLNSGGIFFVEEELLVGLGGLLIGIFASLAPAWLAYRSDISATLSKA